MTRPKMGGVRAGTVQSDAAAQHALEQMMEYLRQRRELAFDLLNRLDRCTCARTHTPAHG